MSGNDSFSCEFLQQNFKRHNIYSTVCIILRTLNFLLNFVLKSLPEFDMNRPTIPSSIYKELGNFVNIPSAFTKLFQMYDYQITMVDKKKPTNMIT